MSLKSQMRRANKLGARFVVICGEDELANGTRTIKDMRSGEQFVVKESAVVDFITNAKRRSEG